VQLLVDPRDLSRQPVRSRELKKVYEDRYYLVYRVRAAPGRSSSTD